MGATLAQLSPSAAGATSNEAQLRGRLPSSMRWHAAASSSTPVTQAAAAAPS